MSTHRTDSRISLAITSSFVHFQEGEEIKLEKQRMKMKFKKKEKKKEKKRMRELCQQAAGRITFRGSPGVDAR